jgi:hypothetical protein
MDSFMVRGTHSPHPVIAAENTPTSGLAAYLKKEFSYTDFLQVFKYLKDFLDPQPHAVDVGFAALRPKDLLHTTFPGHVMARVG